MGNSQYTIWARQLKSDKYETQPRVETDELYDAVSYFQHYVYAYALNQHRGYQKAKAFYLYQDSWRLAKCMWSTEKGEEEDTLIIHMRDHSIQKLWFKLDEMIPEGKWPFWYQHFIKKFSQCTKPDDHTVVYTINPEKRDKKIKVKITLS